MPKGKGFNLGQLPDFWFAGLTSWVILNGHDSFWRVQGQDQDATAGSGQAAHYHLLQR